MSEKLKNFISKSKIIDFVNRRGFSFWAVLFSLILGIALPVYHAQAAGLLGNIINIGSDVIKAFANIFIGSIFQLIVFFGNVLITIAAGILTWALQLNLSFTALTYADGTKTIVGVGWPLVRDLANIGLILALVYIGLATALRMAGFETQRTFLTLLVIALLINFTPQICGLVIDASNILINFFLKDVILSGWDDVAAPFMEAGSAFLDMTGQIIENPGDFTFLGKSIGLAFYGFMGAAIIFIYAIIFILRYIAIWILVIISPIYFVAYILPSTRKYFSEWWNQFFQWCIIGVSCSFFLYLSRHLLYRATTNTLGMDTSSAPGAVASVLPYFVVVGLLWYGLFIALSSSATGSAGVISGGQMMAKKGRGWLTERRPIKEGLGKIAADLAGSGVKPKGRVDRALYAAATPFRWMAKPIAPMLTQYAAESRKAAIPKDFGNWSVLEQQKFIENSRLTPEDRVQFNAAMAKEDSLKHATGDFQKKSITEAKKFKENPNFQKELNAIADIFPEEMDAETRINMKATVEMDPVKKQAIKNAAKGEIKKVADEITKEALYIPELDAKITEISGERGITRDQAAQDMAAAELHMKSLSTDKVKKIAKPETLLFTDGMVRFGSKTQISAAAIEHGEDFVNNYMLEADQKGLEWFKDDKNKKGAVLTYLNTTPARVLGFRPPNPKKKVTPDDSKTKEKWKDVPGEPDLVENSSGIIMSRAAMTRMEEEREREKESAEDTKRAREKKETKKDTGNDEIRKKKSRPERKDTGKWGEKS